MRMTRESLLIATLVELADNLVDEFDVIEVLTMLCNRCVETIDIDAAGVMLASPAGELQYVASSSETMRELELYQIQTDEGPCIDCFNSGESIIDRTLNDAVEQWLVSVCARSNWASTPCTACPCGFAARHRRTQLLSGKSWCARHERRGLGSRAG